MAVHHVPLGVQGEEGQALQAAAVLLDDVLAKELQGVAGAQEQGVLVNQLPNPGAQGAQLFQYGLLQALCHGPQVDHVHLFPGQQGLLLEGRLHKLRLGQAAAHRCLLSRLGFLGREKGHALKQLALDLFGQVHRVQVVEHEHGVGGLHLQGRRGLVGVLPVDELLLGQAGHQQAHGHVPMAGPGHRHLEDVRLVEELKVRVVKPGGVLHGVGGVVGVVQQQEHRLFPRGLLHVGAGLGAGDGVLPLGQVEHQAAALQLHLGKTALHNGQLVHALGDAVLGQAELRQQRHSGQRVVHVDGAGVGQGELPGAVGALHGHAACVLVNGADVVPGLRRSEPALGAVGPANVGASSTSLGRGSMLKNTRRLEGFRLEHSRSSALSTSLVLSGI